MPDPATVSEHVCYSKLETGSWKWKTGTSSPQLPAPNPRELTFVDAAREGLAEEMARDARIFVVGEGIGPRGGNFNTTLGLYDLYGEERLRDSPISERGFTNLCTGAAATGTRPIVDFMFIDFLADAFGDMFNQMCKLQWMSSGRLKMPIVVRGCVGAAQSNAAHHSGNYYPFFMHIPGFRVVMPSTPADAKGSTEDRHPLRRPGALPGAQESAGAQRPGAGRRIPDPVRTGGGAPHGRRPDHGRHRFHGETGAGCRRAIGRGGRSRPR